MEPLISFVTALLLSLSLWLGGGAAPRDAVLVGPAALQTLTETYPAETARITEHTGNALRWIDETNLETVKRTAIANLGCEGYDFSGFLSDLALLCAEARLDAACAAAEAVDGGRHLENVVCSIARTYGPQKGCYLTEVNAGSSESYSETLTMGVESGEELDGLQLTGDVSKRDSITFRAAGYDAVLTDGQMVTHQAAVGIFYGAVLRVEYDRVDTRTGTASHHISYVLEETTAETVCYSVPVSWGIPFYIQSISGDFVVKANNAPEFRAAFEEDPAVLLTEPKKENTLPRPSSKMFGLEGMDAALYDAAVDAYSIFENETDLILPSLTLITEYEDEEGCINYVCLLRDFDYYDLATGLDDKENPVYNFGSGGYYAQFVVQETEDGEYFCVERNLSQDGEGWADSIRRICGSQQDVAEAIINNEDIPVQTREITSSDPEELLRIYLDYNFR